MWVGAGKRRTWLSVEGTRDRTVHGKLKKESAETADDKLDTLTCRVAGSVELMATNGYLLCS